MLCNSWGASEVELVTPSHLFNRIAPQLYSPVPPVVGSVGENLFPCWPGYSTRDLLCKIKS